MVGLVICVLVPEVMPSILKNYRKAAAFLLRRGFSSSVIHSALAEAGVEDEFPDW